MVDAAGPLPDWIAARPAIEGERCLRLYSDCSCWAGAYVMRRRRSNGGLVAAVVAGGGQQQGTPPGTYTISVIGTSGTLTHQSSPITLIVNQ